MALKAIFASILAAGTAVAASVGQGHTPSPVANPCSVVTSQPLTDVMAAIHEGVPVARDGQLAVVDGPSLALSTQSDGGMVRHVASDPRFGVVYVRDLPGGDDVVAETPSGEIQSHRPAEVSHPTWTPGGDIVWGEGGRLWFWSHHSGAISSTAGPVPHGLVFSPVAPTTRSVVAAVVETLDGKPTEDEYLSNLWRFDLEGKEWHQMTRFHATTDRWSVIRTPVAGPHGIEFIRVHGSASATREPAFERWSLHGDHARLDEVLPQERYLAGYSGGSRLWNLPSSDSGTWILSRETNSGALRQLGCGAVEVDPIDVPDPDRLAHAGPPSSAPNYPLPSPSPTPPAHEVAVLVGDYAGESGATNAAQQIIAAYGPDAQVKVVDSIAAPTALKPGAWGAIMWIGAQADPVSAIQRFWAKLPQFADNSWVVAP